MRAVVTSTCLESAASNQSERLQPVVLSQLFSQLTALPVHVTAQFSLQPVERHVWVRSQLVRQPLPEQSDVHDFAFAQSIVQFPPAHVVVHVALSSQRNVQPPLGQSKWHVAPP
jgi:hypothetical protein